MNIVLSIIIIYYSYIFLYNPLLYPTTYQSFLSFPSEKSLFFKKGTKQNTRNKQTKRKYLSLLINSLVLLREFKTFPAEQEKKFQGAIPIKTEIKKVCKGIPICGKVIFMIQFGLPGNSLRPVK